MVSLFLLWPCWAVIRIPGFLMAIFVGKQGSSNFQWMITTQFDEQVSIFIHSSNSMLSHDHDVLKVVVSRPNSCIVIAYHQHHISIRNPERTPSSWPLVIVLMMSFISQTPILKIPRLFHRENFTMTSRQKKTNEKPCNSLNNNVYSAPKNILPLIYNNL